MRRSHRGRGRAGCSVPCSSSGQGRDSGQPITDKAPKCLRLLHPWVVSAIDDKTVFRTEHPRVVDDRLHAGEEILIPAEHERPGKRGRPYPIDHVVRDVREPGGGRGEAHGTDVSVRLLLRVPVRVGRGRLAQEGGAERLLRIRVVLLQ